MNRMAGLAGIISIGLGAVSHAQETSTPLREELAPLQPLAGACWHGYFPGGEQYDVHCFEVMYGGQYLRDVHAVPGEAVYRGETLYHWDAETGSIRYRYYNSIGGVSDGTAQPDGNVIRFPDETHRAEDGSQMIIASELRFDQTDSYLAISTDVTDPDNPRDLFTVRFERISRARADELIEGGL